MGQGFYSFQTNSIKREISAVLSGRAESPEEVQKFLDAYQKTVAAVDPSNYTLVLDCKGMSLTSPDMMSELENCMNLYKSSGFKGHKILLNDNPVFRKQLERASKRSGLPNVEWV